MSEYKYLIIFDIEATCIEGGRITPQEVIELPVVIVDVDAASAVDEWREFVRPVVHSKLDPFCTRLTGITQATVDAADTFPGVFARLMKWLMERGYAENGLVVTVGDWDCRTALPAQAAMYNNTVPSLFSRWCNIKHVFERVYSKRAGGMLSMLRQLRLPLEGRHHSGLDDCRNTARIALHILRDLPDAFDVTAVSNARGGRKFDKRWTGAAAHPAAARQLAASQSRGPGGDEPGARARAVAGAGAGAVAVAGAGAGAGAGGSPTRIPGLAPEASKGKRKQKTKPQKGSNKKAPEQRKTGAPGAEPGRSRKESGRSRALGRGARKHKVAWFTHPE